jgi:hypothetical protein
MNISANTNPKLERLEMQCKEPTPNLFLQKKNQKIRLVAMSLSRYRPARLDLHESGIIGKPFKSTSTGIGF